MLGLLHGEQPLIVTIVLNVAHGIGIYIAILVALIVVVVDARQPEE